MSEAPDTHNGNGSSRNLPVLAREADAGPSAAQQTLTRPAESSLPSPVVAATGGFLAGVAAFVLVRVLRPGRGGRRGLRLGRRRDRGLQVAGSRSFLVDVHVLKR